MKLTNTFVNGRMNLDISERLIPNGEYGYAVDIEVTNPKSDTYYETSDGSVFEGAAQARSGALRNTLGNVIPINTANDDLILKDILLNTLVNASCIGACVDQATNSIYYFVTSDTEDIIARYIDTPNISSVTNIQGYVGSLSYVLRAPKPASPSGRYLNFKKTSLITANFFNGFLFWTDNLNPPRMLEVKLSVPYNGLNVGSTSSSWDQDDINVIVKPPVTSPIVQMFNDGTQKNYMKDRFLYFSYRFKYRDGRWSSMAPFSAVAFNPSVFVYNSYTGTNDGMTNKYNSCNITVATGARQVTDIQILFKDSEFSNIYIIETINKLHPIVGTSPILDNSTWVYKSFDNSKIYSTLPSNQLTRLFDNVPLKSQTQDIIGSRIVYGNYTQYYDLKDSFNGKIIPNYATTVKSADLLPASVQPSLKTNRDYQLGFLYLDDYGRMSTVVTSAQDSTHIPASNSKKRNWIELKVAHYPPSWATKYRLAIRQNRGAYYNIYPTYAYQDGAYVWFMMNGLDKDKVNIGDYVVVKSEYTGPTFSGLQKMVIDIKEQSPSGGPQGLYFKIQYTLSSLTPSTSVYAPNSIKAGYIPGLVTWYDASTSNNSANSYLVCYPPSTAPSPLSFKMPYTSAYYVSSTTPPKDYRFIIEYNGIVSGNHTLNYRSFELGSSYIGSAIPFRNATTGATIPVQIKTSTTSPVYGTLIITPTAVIGTGYSWRLNIYSKNIGGKTAFGSPISGCSLVIPTKTTDTIIYPGSNIHFEGIIEGSIYGLSFVSSTIWQSSTMDFTSSNQYVDIQEWFYEDFIYNQFIQNTQSGTTVNGYNVFFRYASSISQVSYTSGTFSLISLSNPTTSGYIYMCISSTRTSAPATGYIYVMGLGNLTSGLGFGITYQEKILCLETIPKQNDSPVFHECTEDLSILTLAGGQKVHGGNVQSQDLSNPAIISLDAVDQTVNHSFNCWAFHNGVESDRIRDGFNQPTMEWSPRVLVPVDDYKQEIAYANLTYSGTYNYDSPSNNLNQFNLSLGNYKQLDKSFGSVQKIKSRDTDIVVLQQDKISKVLFGKNLLSDSVGGGQVASIPEVLGTQIAYEGQFGISNNPESFAQWGDDMYFTDSLRGAVLRLNNQGLFDLSTQGMKSFFNHNFKIQPDTIKIGVYDPYYKRYLLSETDKNKTSNSITVTNPSLSTPPAAYASVGYATVGVTLPA